MFLALVKGKEDMKALIVKEKTKKEKKQIGILNMERRFRGPAKRALEFATLSNEGDNQEEDNKNMKEEDNNPGSDGVVADYSGE